MFASFILHAYTLTRSAKKRAVHIYPFRNKNLRYRPHIVHRALAGVGVVIDPTWAVVADC